MTDDEILAIAYQHGAGEWDFDLPAFARAIEELAAKRGAAAEKEACLEKLRLQMDGWRAIGHNGSPEMRAVADCIDAIRARSET